VIRAVVVIAATLLLAIQVVRSAAVRAMAERQPDVAGRYWADHPATLASRGMTEIAQAAHDRRAVPASAFQLLAAAARREPLMPEPFLVRGVQSQVAGDLTAAHRAFEAAQRRDPRSPQAAYFLSDDYLRSGDVRNGLRQIALLSRLTGSGPRAVAPYLAAYAAQPANWAELRRLFATNPQLAEPTLTVLSSKAQTAPAVLELADRRRRLRDAIWLPTLLNTLTTAGDYARARSIWEKAAGTQGSGLIHDARFSDKDSPPPFNWVLTSSTVGLAERQPGGRLHLLYYGQEDGILATQLLLLTPGSYRLSMQLLGDRARGKALNWSIWCDKAAAPISSVTLDKAVPGWRFDVPTGCAAQWLKLSGASTELPQQVDTTIAKLKLERVAPGA
jgi:hypothetical protein